MVRGDCNAMPEGSGVYSGGEGQLCRNDSYATLKLQAVLVKAMPSQGRMKQHKSLYDLSGITLVVDLVSSNVLLHTGAETQYKGNEDEKYDVGGSFIAARSAGYWIVFCRVEQFQFEFKKEEQCKHVCTKTYDTKKTEDRQKLEFLKKGMLLNYQHHWIVDNMPVTWCYDVEDGQKFCNPGFPIGCYVTEDGRPKDACVVNSEFNDKDTFYIFNHVDITIFYHVVEHEAAGSRLVAAKMEPKSIMNSLVIVLFLSGMVAMIMLRTLHKDIARYNQMDSIEDAQEEFGWKLVHGDVFRPPRKGMLLSVFLGSGTQIFIMTFVTLFFACLGFLSPANRGALMTCAMVLWVLLGTPAGYVAARFYKLVTESRHAQNQYGLHIVFVLQDLNGEHAHDVLELKAVLADTLYLQTVNYNTVSQAVVMCLNKQVNFDVDFDHLSRWTNGSYYEYYEFPVSNESYYEYYEFPVSNESYYEYYEFPVSNESYYEYYEFPVSNESYYEYYEFPVSNESYYEYYEFPVSNESYYEYYEFPVSNESYYEYYEFPLSNACSCPHQFGPIHFRHIYYNAI
ncbi:UNVERIFIED_CONTAM: hypothetical protein FKN15_024445 [Acipenser sinensis]